MTEESSTITHLSDAMTTTGMMQITGGNTMLSFYFQCAVLVIGVVGTATNGLVLYALLASKQHKKLVLIVNQNVLDLFASFMMVLSSLLKLCNIHLTGSVGYWLCTLLYSDNFFWAGSYGSCINLASITVDRYLKVVHSVWSKKKLHNWMIYSALAFSWIGGIVSSAAVVFSTTAVRYGVCYAYTIWASNTARKINFFWNFISFYLIIILIFVFCYWRILVVIRRQANVMASHVAAAGPSTSQAHAQAQSNQIQTNVIKTMILVSALFAISWLPMYVYILDLNLNPNPIYGGYYPSLVIAFLYTCTNPFIYAIKFDPVKEVLLGLIPCKKNSG